MSLEKIDTTSDQRSLEHILTPDIMLSLERSVEVSVGHLAEKNMAMLEKAKLITSPQKQKEIIMKLGRGSIEAAKAVEQLKRELREREIKQSKLN
jgi:hypothetical protein